ncbi:MAG: amino acid adenylation domain-containing protein [Candidatus Aminicenantes bacterium]
MDERLPGIPIGKPLNNTFVYLLDRWMHPVPPGAIGELYLGGEGVARGYLNRPELTAEKFILAHSSWLMADSVMKQVISQSPMSHQLSTMSYIYHTGDLGRWLPDGNMEFLGRKDHQVKIRGLRIELEEIENQLLVHHQIKEAVVIARQDNVGEGYLAAYIVPGSAALNDPDNMNELRSYLSLKLPGYMIPSHFALLEKIPLTPSGKVDRKALPEPGFTSKGNYVPPQNDTETRLATIWAEVLGLDKKKVGIHDNFFLSGGHSLKATTLIGRIHKDFCVGIPLAVIFKNPTIKDVSHYIMQSKESLYLSIVPVEKREYYPLSSAQKRLFVIEQMDPGKVTYNMPAVLEVRGQLDRNRFAQSLKKLIARHGNLRTSFQLIAGEPVQYVHDKVEFEIEYRQSLVNGHWSWGGKGESSSLKGQDRGLVSSSLKIETIVREFIRAFDISRAPLLRVGLIKIKEKDHILMFDMHHIISDGLSIQIFIREFTAFYQGEVVPELRIQYNDFSHWQNAELDAAALKKQEDYWLKCFAGEIPVLTLPYDFPRPAIQSHDGSSLKFKINREQTRQLKQLAQESETTAFILLLAVFNLLLSKLSEQEDIVVGSPVAGRRHPDLESIIGIFINTLALRNYPAAEKCFYEFLAEVKQNSLEAFENQDYQYEELVEKIQPTRDLGRSPIFDVMLVIQNMDMEYLDIPDIQLKSFEYPHHTSKFDMTVNVLEKDHHLDFTLTYCTAIFTENTIRRFIDYFKRALDAILKDATQKIAGIDILTEDEKKQLLYDFNLTHQDYPGDRTIHRLFEEQAQQTPRHIALVAKEEKSKGQRVDGKQEVLHLCYRELNKRASRLARLLRNKGMTRDTIAAIMMDPAPEMIIGILAVLKAGGAYLPIDPEQQAGRVAYMLKDSRALLFLTREQAAHGSAFAVPFLAIDRPELYKGEANNPEEKSEPGDVVYTIYTSGTTGKSKGTLIQHKNLANYVYWFREKVHLTVRDRSVLTSSFSFDLGYTAIYPSILSGCQLHVIPRDTYRSPADLIGYIHQQGITYIKVTPSLFTTIVENTKFSPTVCPGLRLVVLGGEEIKLKDVEKAHRIAPHLTFMNHYGPTEATIGCVARFIDFNRFADYKKWPTIGAPTANMKALILDLGLMMVPVGVPGELCVSGASVARGYLNQSELTKEKFILAHSSWLIADRKAMKGVVKFPMSYELSAINYIYRTGDMARWTHGGALQFLGRIDTQVKIRGYRIEPAEIENRLLTHEAISEAVVIPRRHLSTDADKYLCAYIVLKNPGSIDIPTLKEYLAVELPDYMVPLFFVELERIPLTPNGKLNRKLLPEPETGALTSHYTAPRNLLEKRLTEVWQEILAVDRIGIDDHFFQMGGHSLKAIILISRLNKAFHVEVPLRQIFAAPTIRGLAAYIESKKQGFFTSIDAVEKKEYHELSSAQKRLYILQQMDKKSTVYNMPTIMVLEGEIDKNKLEKVFIKLIHRHESLRTSFHLVNEEAVQRIHNENDQWQISNYQPISNDDRQIINVIKNFIRPFDLSKVLLLRVGLIKLLHRSTALTTHLSQEGKKDKYLLMVDMHHIISDGISRRLLIKELMTLLEGKDLPVLRLQYKDFSHWHNSKTRREALNSQKIYWKRQLQGEIPVLDLPTDYARPAIQRIEGSRLNFEIDQVKTQSLNVLALKRRTTLYMVLLAIYYIFLSKLTDQEDIIIGTPTAGRLHADLDPIIGMFVNTLVLRNYPNSEKTYSEFLNEVKERSLQAFENQDYQYETLVEEVSVLRDASRNPLFDTMFVMQNMGIPRLEIPGLRLKPYDHPIETSKFDLTLIGIEAKERLLFGIEYSASLFDRSTLERFITYFKMIVSGVLKNPDAKICELDILSEEEKRRLLVDFNDTEVDYPAEKTIHELVEVQAKRIPGHTALLRDNVFITYNELNQKSNQLAHLLKARGTGTGTIIGIMMERSPGMLTGILAVLKAGGSYLPLEPGYPDERIVLMLHSSNASILLTRSEILKQKSLALLCQQQHIQVMPVDELTDQLKKESRQNPEPLAGPGDLIYIIFTSGSTGTPKGAGVYHHSFMNLMNWFIKDFSLHQADKNLLLTSLSFDLTQKNLYASLITGGVLCIPGINYFDPGTLLGEIKNNGVTWINCTPGMFYMLVEYEESTKENKLSFLRYVFLGGEPISVPKLIGWLESEGSRAEIVNTYGPTECTDICAFYRIRQPRRFLEENVPLGKPVDNVRLFVLNKDLQLLPVGIAGELVIIGAGIGCGYLNDATLTFRKFSRLLLNDNEPERLIYRTGDRVKRLADGNIEFLGRMDYQVKVRGYRIEMGEIETRLSADEMVAEVVVTAQEDKAGSSYLCAYLVPTPGKKFEADELRKYLSQALPGYMVPSFFVPLDKMPLTPNGKLDRRALPAPALKGGTEYSPPRDKVEQVLAGIWSRLLDISQGSIGIDDNFFQLGGHSLKATLLVGKIHKELEVSIPLAEVFRTPTIRELARYINVREADLYASIQSTEEKEYYPLSSVQKRLAAIHQLDVNSTVYNISFTLLLEGKIDKDKLDDIFRKLTRRHGSLRTSFVIVADEPVQRIHDEVVLEIESHQSLVNGQWSLLGKEEGSPLNDHGNGEISSSVEIGAIIREFIRPFDLAKAPLLRVQLITLPLTPTAPAGRPYQEEAGDRSLLMMDMHHIISDGISGGILVKEFMALAGEEKLPHLKLRYKDYSEWQRGEKQREALKEQENYWKRQFADEIQVLDLPTDFTRPTVQVFDGNHVTFEIGKETAALLKSLALEQGATLFMVLLAIYNILLSKLSSLEDIIVGTPTAGRRHPDLEPIIGMFVNTLVLRNYPGGEKLFSVFLKELKERTLEAFDHQDYQYEDLVNQVLTTRNSSRNPLFDTMFVIQNQNTAIPTVQVNGLKLTPFQYQGKTSKFDLLLIGEEAGEKLSFTFEYSTRLFTADTIRRLIGYFNKIVNSITADPTVTLADIEIITAEEKQQVLFDFNNTSREYPKDRTIHRLFAEQLGQTPDNTAVVGPLAIKNRSDRSDMNYISYRELDNQSNPLAYLLQTRGVKPGTIVGIMLERSLEMIIGILAILKTGGAYMPIDPDYPEERKRYMLKDSGAEILLKSNDFYASNSTLTSTCQASPTNLAYIMYTSGSTGIPKGVMVIHRSVIRLVKNTNYVEFGENQRILQTGALEFDASTFEIWGALLNRLTLYLVEKSQILNPERLKKTLKRYHINTMWMTSPLFNQMVQADVEIFAGLANLLVGGDALSPPHIDRVRTRFPSLKVINGYGPTENTTFSTTFLIDKEYTNIPIGSPIANSTAIIIDKYNHLQPIKVAGELYVGGDGVARGYLNDPELTVERFCLRRPGALFKKTAPGPRKNFLLNSCQYPNNPIPHSPIYMTGDLARWLPDGNIEFLGRIDHQVKLRGFRVEPGEIENRLLSHKGITDAVVLVKQNPNREKYLCAYVVPDSGCSPAGTTWIEEELRNHLLQTLPNYMVPAYFIPLDRLPLTPNGKIDRKALPEPGIPAPESRTIAPQNALQGKLALIWAEILSIPYSKLSIDTDFFEIGGHSLKALQMLNAIQKEFNIKMDFQDIFQYPTIAELSDLIRKSRKAAHDEIEIQSKKEYYDLSYAQKRLWMLYQLDPENPAFNLPTCITLYEQAVETEVRKALERLVERHESFRTYFKNFQGSIVQIIRPQLQVNLETFDLTHLEAHDREARRNQLLKDESLKPFNLETPPLFRMKLIKCNHDEFDVVLTMHHIITDGWSMEVLEREFTLLYEFYKRGRDQQLPSLKNRCVDYGYWQERLLTDKEKMQGAREFWEIQLRGDQPILDLPYDFPKKNMKTKESAAYGMVIPEEIMLSLKKIALEHKGSLFMVLLAGFNLLLYRITGQEELLLGVPGAARQHEDLKNIVGFFVNTLILRDKINPDESFIHFLSRVQGNTLKVLEYQSFPLELLCSEFKIRYPEISVFFNMSIFGNTTRESLKSDAPQHLQSVQDTKFDIACYLGEYKNGITITTHYYKELFKPITIEKIMGLYRVILEDIARNPEKKIGEYQYSLTPKKRQLKFWKHEVKYTRKDLLSTYHH